MQKQHKLAWALHVEQTKVDNRIRETTRKDDSDIFTDSSNEATGIP